MADRQRSTPTLITMLGFAALTIVNSALAVYNSWGDAGSVAFVVSAYAAALLLLFLCLRRFERAGGGGGGRNGAGARYSALAVVGVAAVLCQGALEAHKTRRDDLAASAASLALSYANLVGMTGLFLRTVALARR